MSDRFHLLVKSKVGKKENARILFEPFYGIYMTVVNLCGHICRFLINDIELFWREINMTIDKLCGHTCRFCHFD